MLCQGPEMLPTGRIGLGGAMSDGLGYEGKGGSVRHVAPRCADPFGGGECPVRVEKGAAVLLLGPLLHDHLQWEEEYGWSFVGRPCGAVSTLNGDPYHIHSDRAAKAPLIHKEFGFQ